MRPPCPKFWTDSLRGDWLKQLLGDQKAATLIKQANSDNLNIEEVERILLELLGCPYQRTGAGLYTSQVEVEVTFYHKHRARVQGC